MRITVWSRTTAARPTQQRGKKAAVADYKALPGGDGRAAGPQSRTTDPQLDADMAIIFEQIYCNMACLMSVHKELQVNGLVKGARVIYLAIATERRRMRGLARGDGDVALALESRPRRGQTSKSAQCGGAPKRSVEKRRPAIGSKQTLRVVVRKHCGERTPQ